MIKPRQAVLNMAPYSPPSAGRAGKLRLDFNENTVGCSPRVIEFLTGKWASEHEYRLIKELWACDGDRIAVRFAYEWHDDGGQWYRAYGNENWKFDGDGYMAERHASINDVPIAEADRKFPWDRSGPRPQDHPGLSDLGL